MNPQQILHHRLANQQLVQSKFDKAHSLLEYLGPIQAQDYAHARHAIGLRLPNANDATVESAIEKKQIIRTWAFRGTLHIIAAKDVRNVLSLIGQRVIDSCASRYRNLELDEKTLSTSYKAILKALEGNKQLSREELTTVLAKVKVEATGVRLMHILHKAALEQLVCYGTKKGSDVTCALLDDCVPPAKSYSKEETLAKLATKYFQSHGPATLNDFIWWSSLSTTDAKSALALVKNNFESLVIDNETYWFKANEIEPKENVFLLPGFDEYFLGYKNRNLALDANLFKKVVTANGIFYPTIVVNGKVEGTWKRVLKGDTVVLETNVFEKLSKAENQKIREAAEKYAVFLQKNLIL